MKQMQFGCWLILLVLCFNTCQDRSAYALFTGRTVSYPLMPVNDTNESVLGTVTIREKTDGLAQLEILFSKPMQNVAYTTSLFQGSLQKHDTIAHPLSPLQSFDQPQGQSITTLTSLNETPAFFEDFIRRDACIKVYAQPAEARDRTVVGAANIGASHSAKDAPPLLDQKMVIC